MHVAVLMLLCSVVIHVGVSQSLPSITPQRCDLLDKFNFFLSNGVQCLLSFTSANDRTISSVGVANALMSLCRDDCGGISSQFLGSSSCNDTFAAEHVRISCSPANGSATVGDFCIHAMVHRISDAKIFDELSLCDNVTSSSSCNSGCRDVLIKIKAMFGCCFQNVYNNTKYNEPYIVPFGQEDLTRSRFSKLKNLTDPDTNPWTICAIEPPQRCSVPFQPPAPPNCTINDHITFLSSLPNAAVCGPSLGTVLSLPANDSTIVANALDTACTDDCVGVYSDYLISTCNDNFQAETLRIWCTRTNGNSNVGPYCRFAADAALISDLSSCSNVRQSCTPSCRSALLQFADQIGCCYQEVFNNTFYFQQLAIQGIITPSEFSDFTVFNHPTGNVWGVCNVPAPSKCPDQPPPVDIVDSTVDSVPPRCEAIDRLPFLASLPNGIQCVSSFAVLTNKFATPSQVASALQNVCNDGCGGIYSKYLEFPCNDPPAAEFLRITCTPTNGSAGIGDVCHYALPSVMDNQLLSELSSCDIETFCPSDCRETLIKLKNQTGCCFQSVYNNTNYDSQQFLDNGILTPSQYASLQKLTDSDSNPWERCAIEPPQSCADPLFEPPPPPQCTEEDLFNFLSSLPNATVCAQSIRTLSLPTNDSTELTRALDNVCNDDCGGAYIDFLRSTCNDHAQAEGFRIWCIRTHGYSDAGPYCRLAFDQGTDLGNELSACNNITSLATGPPCSTSCRSALIKFADLVGCCYQDLFNNTFYYQQLVLNDVITPSEYSRFLAINGLALPLRSPWTECGVPAPSKCPVEPPPVGCPRGTYRHNLMCEECPANTNITLSGGNATVCPCLEGFFRTVGEGPSEKCSAPPDGCRNIQAIQRTATQITLRWKKPINTGRDDFYYQIEYSDGENTGEHSLENKMDYVQEVISGLKPDTSYEFTVTVNNGVSDQDTRNEKLRSCELTTRTMEGRSSPPRDVQGFCSVVVWRMPRNPNGKIVGYDVQLNRRGDVMSTGSDGTFLAVEKEYQQIETLFQVRAKTSAGAGNWSQPIPLGCEEPTVITCPPCNCLTTSQPPKGLHFILGGRIYGNNSEVSLLNVGEGEANALTCRTDNTNCCGSVPNRFGQFYYPNGVRVPVGSAGQGFYRNRGNQVIRLNRRVGATSPTGRYRCEIPDTSGEMQNIYITLS